VSALPRIAPRAPDRDPSGDDLIAAMGGLGRNERCYIELGDGNNSVAVYYEPDWDDTEDGSTPEPRRGAWVIHQGSVRNRKPFSTLNEALTEALKLTGALL
jgi:hypothetical protein